MRHKVIQQRAVIERTFVARNAEHYQTGGQLLAAESSVRDGEDCGEPRIGSLLVR
jgi:hypothetical protein